MEAGGNLRYLAMLQLARATSEEALGRDHDALASFKRYDALQQELQDKMRLEQGRLLRYEYEIRQRDFENQRLRAERQTQAQQNLGPATDPPLANAGDGFGPVARGAAGGARVARMAQSRGACARCRWSIR